MGNAWLDVLSRLADAVGPVVRAFSSAVPENEHENTSENERETVKAGTWEELTARMNAISERTERNNVILAQMVQAQGSIETPSIQA